MILSAFISSIATAVPEHEVKQDNIVEFLSSAMDLSLKKTKLLQRVYKSTGIDNRYSVISDYNRKLKALEFFPEFSGGPYPSTSERMVLYKNNALSLALKAITKCFSKKENFDNSNISHVITVSCTGMYAPGLDLEIIVNCRLIWIYATVKKKYFNKGKELLKVAKSSLNFLKKDKKIGKNYYDYLVTLVMIEEARIIYQKKKSPMKAIEVLTNALQVGKKVCLEVRKEILDQIKCIMIDNSIEPTFGQIELLDRQKRRKYVKEFVICLDYSRSMKFNNRIETAIACILQIWDTYIQPHDRVAFIRYNQNVEVTFKLEEKQVNSFAKRNSIENSIKPKERTSLYDSIIKAYSELNKSPIKKIQRYCIIFSDGADTSSVADLENCYDVILRSKDKICLVGIGMGLNDEEIHNFTRLCNLSKGGRYINFDFNQINNLFDTISGYARDKLERNQYEDEL